MASLEYLPDTYPFKACESYAAHRFASLLRMVDGWRAKVRKEIEGLTAREQAAYWRGCADEVRAAGLRVIEPGDTIQPRKKRRPRKTG
jgi:hypothetical protein